MPPGARTALRGFRGRERRILGELIRPDDIFDVIYLDGLHTFDQTLRDFCNAIQFLQEDGVIVIDDVIPNSYSASIPDASTAEALKGALKDRDQTWMSDVFRRVFFFQAFPQQYDYATIAENLASSWCGEGPGGERS
jgi:predicted O-methyltransferase YrrM